MAVTQNAQAAVASQQTRAYTFDALRRLTSETNPETAKISYTYDTDSTCGTSAGDRVKRIDNAGNTTCYAYDKLHRVISQTYIGTGPNVANTANKYFVYDSATVNGLVMANTKGLLAEAYTTAPGAASTAAKVTDIGLSYSHRGELTDLYESTPHSGAYNHSSTQFWENGALKQLTGPGLPAFTIGLDGEGRAKTISASVGQNPVTATAYNTASQPTAVTLGSGDSDAFTYDPNTLRLAQYKFNVAAQSVTGNLGWNANGSLGSLNIADPFSSSDTQNCSYTADDLSRINSANCGAVWGQTFSYDAFGNVSKQAISTSAGTTFLPTYQTSPSITNRIASLPGGITPAYDANGNSTSDGFRQYTWDAENRPLAAVSGSTTVNLTYDALGRMVEQARGTSYTQIVYSTLGGKLAKMNGATLQAGYIPLPSGANAVYTSGGLAYYRHTDHLGTSRFASTPTQTMFSDTAYSAFGEPYAQSGTADPSFTGQDQDTVPGVYDFLFRKYDPAQSRWTSPDPSGLASVDPTNPQSWNRYAYVLNSPLNSIDPLGLRECHANDDGTLYTFNGDCSSSVFNGPGYGSDGGTGFGSIDTSQIGLIDSAFSFVQAFSFGFLSTDSAPIYIDCGGPCFTIRVFAFAYADDPLGTFGGNGGSGGSLLGGLTSAAQCAANNAASAASFLHISKNNFIGQAFLGNDISSISQFITGSNKAAAALQLTLSSPFKYNAFNVVTKAIGSVRVADGGIAVVANGAGTYYAVGGTTAKLAATSVGKVASGTLAVLTAVKLAADAVNYGRALAACISDPSKQ